jgi:hypothetical protein
MLHDGSIVISEVEIVRLVYSIPPEEAADAKLPAR